VLPLGMIKQKNRYAFAKSRKATGSHHPFTPLRQSPCVPLFSLKTCRPLKVGKILDLYLSIKIARRKEAVKVI
jgi:hypothetical protein